MLNFFNNNDLSKSLPYWAKKVWTLIDENPELKSKIDQAGILNGNQIIAEYLENQEWGLAYQHLSYLIRETGIYLTPEEIGKVSQIAPKLGVEIPDLQSPSPIEIEEFYRILDLFHATQRKVVKNLTEIWGMESPMTNTQWISWNHKQYEKDQFKNEQGIKIYAHGFGLSYQDAEIYIDFDFGEHGEINGFDVHRLWDFIEENKINTLFRHVHQIEKVLSFEMAHEKLIFSGYINYYKK